jgi:hypothetical protein
MTKIAHPCFAGGFGTAFNNTYTSRITGTTNDSMLIQHVGIIIDEAFTLSTNFQRCGSPLEGERPILGLVALIAYQHKTLYTYKVYAHRFSSSHFLYPERDSHGLQCSALCVEPGNSGLYSFVLILIKLMSGIVRKNLLRFCHAKPTPTLPYPYAAESILMKGSNCFSYSTVSTLSSNGHIRLFKPLSSPRNNTAFLSTSFAAPPQVCESMGYGRISKVRSLVLVISTLRC